MRTGENKTENATLKFLAANVCWDNKCNDYAQNYKPHGIIAGNFSGVLCIYIDPPRIGFHHISVQMNISFC